MRFITLILSGCILIGCARDVKRKIESYNERNRFIRMSENLIFDTLKGYFYYEEYTPSYNYGGDYIFKNGGFIRMGDINVSAYKEAYFKVDMNFILKHLASLPVANVERMAKFRNLLIFLPSGSDFMSGTLVTGCNLHYRKVYMEFVALRIGKSKEIIPDFRSCKELMVNKAKSIRFFVERQVNKYILMDVIRLDAGADDWRW